MRGFFKPFLPFLPAASYSGLPLTASYTEFYRSFPCGAVKI